MLCYVQRCRLFSIICLFSLSLLRLKSLLGNRWNEGGGKYSARTDIARLFLVETYGILLRHTPYSHTHTHTDVVYTYTHTRTHWWSGQVSSSLFPDRERVCVCVMPELGLFDLVFSLACSSSVFQLRTVLHHHVVSRVEVANIFENIPSSRKSNRSQQSCRRE